MPVLQDRKATDEERRQAALIVAAVKAIKRIIAKERNEDAATTERQT